MSVMTAEKKKIHPYKFTLWVAMGSMLMMFAGFTSAYIVKRNQANWQGFDLPSIFAYSTVVILLSSATMQLAVKNIRNRNMQAYRQLLLVTAILGIAFLAMQWAGFVQLNDRGIKLIGQGSNVSGSFLAVIAGMHMLHVAGGIVALVWMLRNALFSKTRNYSAVPAEVAAQYWHFVDLLWIYLFVFLQFVS
ncbi:cytochrome c oxidase subunit 3 [Phnomibacter sp. MR]|uniref:cytochrome c oxidase subunit 3 n=1 Tax=Phnomibacter sp. MR TaxID=3042318 RepID=UPI003A80DBB4